MNPNRELDRLLDRLRLDPSTCALDDVEQRVWQQIAGSGSQMKRAGMGLPLVLASVVAAFLWGIFTGVDVTAASAASPGLLVEEMDLLPPDPGSMQL
jgi:hypothetical protein